MKSRGTVSGFLKQRHLIAPGAAAAQAAPAPGAFSPVAPARRQPAREKTDKRQAVVPGGGRHCIGGVLIPRPDLTEDDHEEVEALNEMWTGITLRHLQRIAQNANRNNRPGVILVSLDRPDIVAEVIRQGLVNELIIDRPATIKVARLLADGRASVGPTRGDRDPRS